MNLHLPSEVREGSERTTVGQSLLVMLATAVLLGGGVFSFAQVRGSAPGTIAKPAAQTTASVSAGGAGWIAPAYRKTYYLVRSEEQAAFEAGINECNGNPGCLAGRVVWSPEN